MQSKSFVQTHTGAIISGALSESDPPLSLSLLSNQVAADLDQIMRFFQDIAVRAKSVNRVIYMQYQLSAHEVQMTKKFGDLLKIYGCLEQLTSVELKMPLSL